MKAIKSSLFSRHAGAPGITMTLALSIGAALYGCTMRSPAHAEAHMSKTEMRLNVRAIPDPDVRAQAHAASADITRTLLVLGDSRLDHEEAQQKLAWSGAVPLLLPPEWRGPGMGSADPHNKRFPMPFMKAEHWAAPDATTVLFVAMFTDGGKPELEVRERQTYRHVGGRWTLVKQERLVAP